MKPLDQPKIKPNVYTWGQFDKSKIKLGAAIQCEQQKQKVERWLEQDVEVEKTQEELENIVRKEEAKLRWTERYEWRTKEKEGKEDMFEVLVVESTSKSTADTAQSTENPGKVKLAKTKNPWGRKTKQEIEVVQEIKEQEKDEEIEEMTTKQKIVGCINKEEAAAFQEYVHNRMIILVEKMWNNKNIIQPIRELIRALKMEYNNLGLFENNGATDIEEIVHTIPETTGTA